MWRRLLKTASILLFLLFMFCLSLFFKKISAKLSSFDNLLIRGPQCYLAYKVIPENTTVSIRLNFSFLTRMFGLPGPVKGIWHGLCSALLQKLEFLRVRRLQASEYLTNNYWRVSKVEQYYSDDLPFYVEFHSEVSWDLPCLHLHKWLQRSFHRRWYWS